jgi:putative tricarboxylic transport membrane protein
VSSFLSYLVEKRISTHPEEFGKGAIEGVAGPETANNAASSAAMIPFLGLGIPTGPPAAVMMIALLIHGIRPGPLFIRNSPGVLGLIAGIHRNVILLVLNLPLVSLFVSCCGAIPLLFPIILLVCLVGTFGEPGYVRTDRVWREFWVRLRC